MSTASGLPTSTISLDDKINYLNIGLMLASLVAAFILPFELFLFSYAVLGPLHYLTEISWLDKKDYFLKSRNDIVVFGFFVLLMTVAKFNHKIGLHTYFANFVFTAFVYALIQRISTSVYTKGALLIAAFILSVALNVGTYKTIPYLLFAVLMPTLIHVYLFTALFILFGAIKTKSISGIASLVFFVLCTIAFFLFTPENFGIIASNYSRTAYQHFTAINTTLYQFFGFGNIERTDSSLFTNPKAIAIMRLIAFSYTYHYLNWFSKTSVIKWNQVSTPRMLTIIVLWIASVGLYTINYKIGLDALFMLSMLHVLFEFPLNYVTFIGIGKSLGGMLGQSKK